MKIGFISANLVARASGYDGSENWPTHDERTRKTFNQEDMSRWIQDVSAMGFEGLSLWTAHCWQNRVTPQNIEWLSAFVRKCGLNLYSLAGRFGQSDENKEDRKHWENTFALARQLGCGWLSGSFGKPENRPMIRELAQKYKVSFAFENHPHEKSAGDILARIDGFEDCIGVAFDTGWAGTCGFSAPDTIRKLGKRIKEIHLKDVREAGKHRTCVLGDGIVGIEACLDALRAIGYDGWLSIEHEPYDHDPMGEIGESIERLRKWLKTSTAKSAKAGT